LYANLGQLCPMSMEEYEQESRSMNLIERQKEVEREKERLRELEESVKKMFKH